MVNKMYTPYGYFEDVQVEKTIQMMHCEIHKLLLYKDNKIEEKIFISDAEFKRYFRNLLYRYGGLNVLLGNPAEMIFFMCSLQAAYTECQKSDFRYGEFRRLILDAHGYLKMMSEVIENAEH